MKVHFQVIEGTRSRVQVFEGVVIKRQGHGARETFTVRKQSFGVGVERMFPVHSPKIERIELAARGDVRRAKLYYLRDRVGKRARVRERRYTGPEDVVEPGLLHEAATRRPSGTVEAPDARTAGRRGGGREARRRRPRRRRSAGRAGAGGRAGAAEAEAAQASGDGAGEARRRRAGRGRRMTPILLRCRRRRGRGRTRRR